MNDTVRKGLGRIAREPGRKLKAAAEFFPAVARRFREDRSIQTAGSLTFTSLLAMVSMITVALALTTAFPVFDQAIEALQLYLVEHFLPDATGVDAITTQISSFTQKAGRLTAIGLAFLTVTAIMVMLTIDEALNRIFRVQRRRPLVQRILIYWSVLTLGPLLIGGSLWMTSFLVGRSLGLLDVDWLTVAALRLVPFVFTCAALAMLYTVVPFRQIQIRHALVGSIVAGAVFELAKRGFGFYIAKVPTYTLIYGAFATVPVFLLWVYVSWVVVLFGATITAMLPGFRGMRAERERAPGRDLFDALAVLTALARAQEGGRALGLVRLALQARLLPYVCERMLERAAALGWTAKTEKGSWVLTRSAATIRVADVYLGFVLDSQAQSGTVETLDPLREPLAAHWKHIESDFALTLADLAERSAAEQPLSVRRA